MATALSKTTQLADVTPFARQLHKFINRVRTAGRSKAAQFVRVTEFPSELDKFINSIAVALRGPRPQIRQITSAHVVHLLAPQQLDRLRLRGDRVSRRWTDSGEGNVRAISG